MLQLVYWLHLLLYLDFFWGGIDSFSGVIKFYKKRIKRFYFLFVLSCISLYIYTVLGFGDFIVSFKQLICTLTGLSCFVKPMPLTIWYFSMMIFFYLMTPIITSQKTLEWKLVASTFIYFFLLLTNIIYQTDSRVILYFPVYSAALFCSSKVNLNEKFNVKIFSIALVGGIMAVWFNIVVITNYITQLVPAVCIAIVIIEVSKIGTSIVTEQLVNWISYASMCAYLFHRQFFGVVKFFFGDIPSIFAYCVFLPLFLVGCYWCQKIYDFIMDLITRKVNGSV